jgi:hypothetical protein
MNEHRLARAAAWAMAVFVWLIAGMPNHTSAGKRHHKRYAGVRIAQLRAFVRNVVLIRAAQLVKPLPLHRFRNYAPAGFRRGHACQTLRRIAGGWLRRRLNCSGSLVRLLGALRQWRRPGAELARRHRKRRLTRLCPMLIVRPPASLIRSMAALAPAYADSS